MLRNFLVHVGFSKTATTTLQKHLFSNHSQIEYLGKPYPIPSLAQQIDILLGQETMIFDSSWAREVVHKSLEHIQDSQKNWMVLSEERLVSCSKVRDKGVVARRIKDVLRPSRVLFTIRNQFDILRDAYKSGGRRLAHAPKRYSSLFVEFDEWIENSYEHCERSYIGHVDYCKTISCYADLFGKENVCILLFEDFVHNQETCVQRLTDFLGIDLKEALNAVKDKHENPTINLSQLNFERMLSKCYPLSKFSLAIKVIKVWSSMESHMKKRSGAGIEFSNYWQRILSDYYKKGNKRLCDEFALPLEKYGYPL